MAGRAVEGMLRALVFKADHDYERGAKSLDTGHDLRNLLTLVKKLGILQKLPQQDPIVEDIQMIARLWWNNMRYASDRKLKDHGYNIRVVGKRRTIKQASQDYYDACSAIIKRCENLWQH